MVDNAQAIIESTAKTDRASKTKTLYDVGPFEIFWRNFLAGASRTFGGIVLYLMLVFVFGLVFARFILPALLPLLNNYKGIFDSLGKLQPYQLPSKLSLP